MGKLIPFLFIALDGKSAVAHLRLRIPGHKLRGSWFSFRWSPVRIVIGSHGLIATVFYFKNYATGIQRQHGMPGSCGHLQHRTGFPFYKVAIFAVLVAIASGGERLLFKISGPMVVVKVGIIVVFGFAMIPHWNFANITAFPQASDFFRDVLLTIPFCFFSAVFIQVLNPMNIAYRKREADKVLATRLALRTHRISYVTLIAVILFFAFSFTFSISHEEAVSAFEQNISALALAAQVIPGHIIHITSTVLNIFAVLTAFFGIYLGFHEAIKGIILNLLSRIIDTRKINSRVLTLAICTFIVMTLTIWVSFRVSVLVFFQLGSPLYGIVSCLIPFFLISKVSQLKKLRGLKTWLILFYGILLCFSPLLKLIE